jgi:TRAP transporter TAXI family solute receptor
MRWAAGLILVLASLAPAQDTGIKVKRPVFGGACKICPWGAVAEIVKEAMQSYGYNVQICYNGATADAPRIVAAAKMPEPIERWWNQFPAIPRNQTPPPPQGPVDFGATSVQNLWWAYSRTHVYASEGPRKNLRLLAVIQSPHYQIVAVKSDLGITDLRQVKERRWPVRIYTDGNEVSTAVLSYYGLTKEAIEAAEGRIGRGAEERANFDVIVHGGTLGNAPEFNVWYEVSQKYDLKYLELSEELLAKLVKDSDMERRNIPNGLLRGIDHPIPTVARTGHAVYGRVDMPDDFAYTVAKSLDEQQSLLQWAHLNFSYDRHTVWKAFGVPLHPGAARYYREMRYMK